MFLRNLRMNKDIPTAISARRESDIPAFYADWFSACPKRRHITLK